MMTGIIVVSYHNAEGTRKYVVKQLSKLSDAYRVIVVAVDATEEYGRTPTVSASPVCIIRLASATRIKISGRASAATR